MNTMIKSLEENCVKLSNINAFSCVPILLFVVFGLSVGFNMEKWKKKQILGWDVCGYHNYLPAIFIYNDLKNFEFYNAIDSIYGPTGNEVKRYALHKIEGETGVCNQYPVGVAIFQSLAFLIAHKCTLNSNIYPADGYSEPYQLAVFLNTFIFSIIGLLILRRFLLQYFKDGVVFLVLVILAFGTNFFNYSILEPGLSHPYLFFLYSSILYLTSKWHTKANSLNSILLGLAIGGCIILRPLDILIFLIPLFWFIDFKSLKQKWQYVITNYQYVLLIILFTFLATTPQMIYWHFATGKFIYYSYSKVDYFEFDRFRVLHGLFSFRRGWFIYSPLLIFSIIGIFFLGKINKLQGYLLPMLIFYLPIIYITFSWHNWFYGWGYGCRALVHTIPLLGLPLGVFINKVSQAREAFKVLLVQLLIVLLSLNIFQNWQYTHGILHGTDMNFKYYKKVFLKTQIGEEERRILHDQAYYDWIHKW